MSDGPGAGQWNEGWKGPRHEYTGFRTRDPVVWSRVFYRSTKRTKLAGKDMDRVHQTWMVLYLVQIDSFYHVVVLSQTF